MKRAHAPCGSLRPNERSAARVVFENLIEDLSFAHGARLFRISVA